MSSNAFASSDSDSDDGAKQRHLPVFRPTPSSQPASDPSPSGDNRQLQKDADGGNEEDCGGGDDEEELSRMRKSGGYATYADRYARNDAAAAERTRRRAAEQATVEANAQRVREARQSVDDGEAAERGLEDGHYADLDGSNDVERRPLLPSGPNVPDLHQAASPRRKPRRAIDPKIVDDSSDEDGDDVDDGTGAGSSDDEVAVGPALPPALSSSPGQARSDGSDSVLGMLPLTHEASLGKNHEAQVCAISLDAAGSRFVTASSDSTLSLWDFGTMTSGLQSFRSVEPLDSGPIASARFSASGGRLVCAGSLRVARVLDRDARPLVETVPGDMYIVDMARTKGHTAPLSDAQWVSGSRDHHLATIAGDSTLRLWDVAAATAPISAFDGELSRAKQTKVIKLRNARGGRANGTAMTFLSGSEGFKGGTKRGMPPIAVGCDDSSIKIVDPNEFSLRPSAENTDSLAPGSCVTALQYGEAAGHGAPLLLARSSDDSLRVFDIRRFDTPLATFSGLPNAAAQTGLSFMGEGESFFVTGTSANRRGGTDCARLTVYNARTLNLAWECGVDRERGSVVAVVWHPRINQLLYGCSDGSSHVMYHPQHSHAGVLRCIGRKERRKQLHGMASIGVGEIYTPNALPMFRDPSAPGIVGGGVRSETKRRQEMAQVPPKSDVAEQSKTGTTFTKAFMASKMTKTWTNDPREALLKYHDPNAEAGKPKPILGEKTREQEEEEETEALMARRKRFRPNPSESK